MNSDKIRKTDPSKIVEFIHSLYPGSNSVLLHAPYFKGNEKIYLCDCIDSTYVSYVGKYVQKFEEMTAEYTGAKYAIAVVNGTAALQIALMTAGVESGDEVITQALTFVATANAIKQSGATPVFIDVDKDTMGMSAGRLKEFLANECTVHEGKCINKKSGKTIKAVVPMHTFGHPCRIDEIVEIASENNLKVIEDSAESLGSFYKGRHTGTFGLAGILSYNGNKTITTGGGGMIITDDQEIAVKAKHITTTGKIPHRWEFVHDITAFNFRLTNLNAAVGVAQMENLEEYLENKRETASMYAEYFNNSEIAFFKEPENARSNYWLNAIVLKNREARDEFLSYTNDCGIQTRPIWKLMNKLDMYSECQSADLTNSEWFEDRVVNIPSGIRG